MNDALREALRHGPECPPLEELLERQGDFGPHLRTCAACQSEIALYRSFEAGEPGVDEREAIEFIVGSLKVPGKVRAKARPEKVSLWQRFFTPAWLGGAAVGLAAILLAVGLLPQQRLSQSGTTASEDHTMRSAVITVTSPTGDLEQPPPAIEWSPVKGAADYSVTLSEVDRTVIFHKNITSSQILLPSAVRKLVVPGKKILLEVTARNASGAEMARSGIVGLRVMPPATNTH